MKLNKCSEALVFHSNKSSSGMWQWSFLMVTECWCNRKLGIKFHVIQYLLHVYIAFDSNNIFIQLSFTHLCIIIEKRWAFMTRNLNDLLYLFSPGIRCLLFYENNCCIMYNLIRDKNVYLTNKISVNLTCINYLVVIKEVGRVVTKINHQTNLKFKIWLFNYKLSFGKVNICLF